jgi:very-short-patch-repair endonuclease/predicted transcriptional regulator of viral defense system
VSEEVAAAARIALTASRQHGVVTSAQLRSAGTSDQTIRRWTIAGRLHRLYRDVYAIGYKSRAWETRWMAAVLACCGYRGLESEDAFLSHASAAALWGLLKPGPGSIDVAIVGETGRARRRGLRIHRPRTLELTMTTSRSGIPVTDPARTIADLRRAKPSRGGATPAQVRRAMRQAEVLGLRLGPGSQADRTRSDLERLFLRICRRHDIPAPEVNVDVGGLEVDFLWRDRRLVVETDGYRYHRGRIAYENDHDRDLRLAELGFRGLRFSETQLENESDRVAAAVYSKLAATY